MDILEKNPTTIEEIFETINFFYYHAENLLYQKKLKEFHFSNQQFSFYLYKSPNSESEFENCIMASKFKKNEASNPLEASSASLTENIHDSQPKSAPTNQEVISFLKQIHKVMAHQKPIRKNYFLSIFNPKSQYNKEFIEILRKIKEKDVINPAEEDSGFAFTPVGSRPSSAFPQQSSKILSPAPNKMIIESEEDETESTSSADAISTTITNTFSASSTALLGGNAPFFRREIDESEHMGMLLTKRQYLLDGIYPPPVENSMGLLLDFESASDSYLEDNKEKMNKIIFDFESILEDTTKIKRTELSTQELFKLSQYFQVIEKGQMEGDPVLMEQFLYKVFVAYAVDRDIHDPKIKSRTPIGVGITVISPAMQIAGIFNISVTESFRGKGFGKQILQFLIEYSFNRGVKNIVLNTNAKKTKIYEEFGFTNCEKGSQRMFFRIGK